MPNITVRRLPTAVKNAAKASVFVLIFLVLFLRINTLLKPVWLEWNNYDRTKAFYSIPDNSVETIFLGASIIVNGVIPAELYENYGLCTYNLGTEQQPIAASYYWLKEAYRTQGGSLKNVVLEASMLRYKPDQAFYKKALEYMALSDVKVEAALALSDSRTEALENLFPIFSYHDRWDELGESDFTITSREVKAYTRGYNYDTYMYIHSNPGYGGTPSYYLSNFSNEQQFDTEEFYYFKQILSFCREHDLRLTLILTPRTSGMSELHNSVKYLAKENGFDFFDFNYLPLFDEVGHNPITDTTDGGHMNYYGAHKVTMWLGKYLSENCGAADHRGDPAYAYMDDELKSFKEYTWKIDAGRITDPVEYINTMVSGGDRTVYITVLDEASNSLSGEQRAAFAQMGLEKLSALQYRESYAAVIQNGQVIYEEMRPVPSAEEQEALSREKADRQAAELAEANDFESVDSRYAQQRAEESEENKLTKRELKTRQEREELEKWRQNYPYAIRYEYSFTNDYKEHKVKLISAGLESGNLSSCIIDGKNYSPSSRGLNIVVWDNEEEAVIDTANFDTFAASNRYSAYYPEALQQKLADGYTYDQLDSKLQALWRYNKLCSQARDNAWAVVEGAD